MPQHLFLCGLTSAQRAQYEGGHELHLHGNKPNLVLKVEDIRKRLLSTEPNLLTDLLELAVYVFAADCLVSRGGRTFEGFGAKWRRSIHLVVAVREPGQWMDPDRLSALRDALHFLSDDLWEFSFVDLENPPSIQGYIDFSDSALERKGDTTIISFSGGVDSFAGAVEELKTTNRHVVLMSRRIPGITENRQIRLADELKSKFGTRVSHAGVRAGLTKETAAREHTQRTRSFLLAAIGMIAAYMEGSNRIRFYENGIMSINLPISGQVTGTRASRSTHPRSLLLLQQFAEHVLEVAPTIDNPFIWNTKIDVLRELQQTQFGAHTRATISCSNTRHLAKHSQHCGVCAQCLQRQISEFGAGASTAVPDLPYAIDFFLGPRIDNEDRDMAVDNVRTSLEFCRLSDAAFVTKYAGELSRVVAAFPKANPSDIGLHFVSLFRQQGQAVSDMFVQTMQAHAEDLLHKRLSPDCLLRLAFSDASIKLDKSTITNVSAGRSNLQGNLETTALASPSTILLAVDPAQKQIRIEGIASLRGTMEFCLMSELVKLNKEDKNNDLALKNYRAMTDKALADVLGTDETAVRKNISRIRKKIRDEFASLHQVQLDLDHVLENIRGKGYRLNPKNVQVVALSEMTS